MFNGGPGMKGSLVIRWPRDGRERDEESHANWARYPHQHTNTSIGKTSSSGTTTAGGLQMKHADLLGLSYREAPAAPGVV